MKIAFLFSGQGSQHTGMMHDLYKLLPNCKKLFNDIDMYVGRSISGLCFDGTSDELNLTQNTQPCVLAADLAAYYAISSFGIKPDVVAGFSLGEYAALIMSEMISLEDGFEFIQKRAEAMQSAVPVGRGAMIAIKGLDETAVRQFCTMVKGYIEPSNYNCPGQIVVSGETEAANQLADCLKRNKVKFIKLPVSAPFHCELMKPAMYTLEHSIKNIKFSNPICPVYMNIDALPVSTFNGVADKLLLHLTSPVRWEQTLINMYNAGVDTFIELGPGSTLASFVKKTLNSVQIYSVNNVDSLNKTVVAIKGDMK